jgi:hypothetical protein
MQVQNKKKTRSIRRRTTQKISSCVTLTRRAHKAGQTNILRRQTPRIRVRTHLSASQRKAVLRGPHQGSIEPGSQPILAVFPASSALAGRKIPPSSSRFAMFPSILWTGTDVALAQSFDRYGKFDWWNHDVGDPDF